MKRALLFSLTWGAFYMSIVQSQTVVFNENFEGVLQVSSSSTLGTASWAITSNYAVSPTKSDSGRVNANDTLFLTTASFSTLGNMYVLLEFDHICKVDYFDVARIEVSVNGGTSWVILTGSQYMGTAPFGVQGNKFSEGSYSSLWQAANPSAIPQNSWFVHETFDISSIAANQSSVMIRFKLGDGGVAGPNQRYGWIIDNIKVTAAPCELQPPSIIQQSPVWQGIVYAAGPYTLNATITDPSGIDTAIIYYSVNGGPLQSAGMTNTGGNNYQGSIPAVANGDIVCYYFYAEDAAAPCNNAAQYPLSGCIQFTYTTGLTPPYFSNFEPDNGNFVDSVAVGAGATQWQWGVPNNGALNSAYSPTKAWMTNLNSNYTPNANCYLTSPVFDFTGVYNATLKFWHKYSIENSWDGFRVQYTTDNINWQTLGTVGDPNATNWYNASSIYSSTGPAWTGSNTANWTESTYNLSFLNNTSGPIRFRFQFTSDGSVEYEGVVIDNFEIYVPQPYDAGVTAILTPTVPVIENTNNTIQVTIKNFGTATLDTIPVAYSINGGAPVIDTVFTNLLPGATTNFTFTQSYVAPSGNFSICAYTQLTGDGYTANDSTCGSSYYGLPIDPVTKFDNFDNDTTWASISNSTTMWQLGTPNYGTTNSAYSQPNSWDINLNSPYGSNAVAYLYSQYYDLSAAQQTKLYFKYNMNTQQNFDGFRLEYSTNMGQTWQTLGVVNDPLGVNWYNSIVNGQPAWSGNSMGWKSAYRDISMLDGTPAVIFRFVFQSDGFTQLDGVSVDDFEVFAPLQKDLKMDAIITPFTDCVLGTSENVTVRVINVGLDTVYSFSLSYAVNGGNPVTENISVPLPPGDTLIYTFSTPVNMLAFGIYVFDVWITYAQDMNMANDSILDYNIENVDGCEFVVQLFMNSSIDPTGYWNVVNVNTNQVIKQVYFSGSYSPNQVVYDTICAPSGAQIAFNLYNSSTFYNVSYNVMGYDTIYLQGSGTTYNATFTNYCPPYNSVASTALTLVGMALPLPKDYSIRLNYKNDGLTDIMIMYAAVEIDGIMHDIDTIVYGAPGLGYNVPQYHIFGNKWNATPGCHQLKAWTFLPNDTADTDPLQDTVMVQYCIMDSTSVFPYCYDFEGGKNEWVTLNFQTFSQTATSWKLGNPNKTNINAPYNGNKCWYTSDSLYWPYEKSALYSPLFLVDSSCYKLSFYHQYVISDVISDGVVVDYTVNQGSSWSPFGAQGDTVNWFNKAVIPGLAIYVPGVGSIQSPGWNGNSQGWKYSSHYIKFNSPQTVIFRFRIGSDFDFHDEGWAIDQVCFEKITNCTLGVGISEVTLAGFELGQNYPNPANGFTKINYAIPYNGKVSFKVFNLLGETLYQVGETKSAGFYEVEINTAQWPAGIYFYSLEFDGNIKTMKMIVE